MKLYTFRPKDSRETFKFIAKTGKTMYDSDRWIAVYTAAYIEY